jgi:hypothetical protein
VESYPGVTSPLTFSFARYVVCDMCIEAFARLMGGARLEWWMEHRAVFENMLGRVDGRVYYNLLNWYRALALFPGVQGEPEVHGRDDGRLGGAAAGDGRCGSRRRPTSGVGAVLSTT